MRRDFCVPGALAAIGVLALSFGGAYALPQPQESPAVVKPEEAGMSAALTQKVYDAVKKHIDNGDVPGVVALISRNDKDRPAGPDSNIVTGRNPRLAKHLGIFDHHVVLKSHRLSE